MTARVDTSANPGAVLIVTATATTASPDADPANNQLQVDKWVEPPGPDLLVALHASGAPGPGVLEAGKEVTYTLHYGNYGNRGASEAAASVRLWPGLALLASQPAPTANQLDAASGVRTLTWSLGALPVAEEGVIELLLRVDDIPAVGSIVQASVISKSIDLNPADNATMETRHRASPNAVGHKIYLPAVRRP